MPYKKICPNCKKATYSACSDIDWVCPNCDRELSDVEPTRDLTDPRKEKKSSDDSDDEEN